MRDILDWVYQVFSSKAVLGEIAFIALLATFATYTLDLSKKREERNAILFNFYSEAYSKTISDTHKRLLLFKGQVLLLFEHYEKVKNGKFHSLIQEFKIDANFLDDPSFKLHKSSNLVKIIWLEEALLAGATVALRNFSLSLNLDSVQKSAGELWKDTENWKRKIERLLEQMDRIDREIDSQYNKGLSRLSRKDSLIQRFRDERKYKNFKSSIEEELRKSRTN